MISRITYLDKYRNLIEAIIVASLLVLLIFPDVIFNNGSLRITDQIFGYKVSSLFELPRTTGWWGGYHDNGGASFQSEPMMEFMKHVISTGQSPYWNPYSSAGSLGPETLVDQKFSLLTILYALFGGGTDVYNIISICLYFFSIFFIYLTIREVFKFSRISAIAGCVFYLLNGFSIANISSNIIQSYLYVPMCIYFSLLYIDRITSVRVVFLILSFSVLLSCTFMPTTITSFLAIYSVVLGYLVVKSSQARNRLGFVIKCLFQHVGLVFLSVILISIIYFPIIESILYSETLSDYSKRIFFPLYFPQALASLYSPSHFYESYNAMEPRALYWVGSRSFPGNTVYHLGVISITLIGCTLLSKKHKHTSFEMVCLVTVLLVLLRLFDVAPISLILSYIPILGTLGAHYWWPAIIIPCIFLVSSGIENLKYDNARLFPVVLLLSVGVASLVYIYKVYGLIEPNIEFKVNSLYVILFLIFISLGLLCIFSVKKFEQFRKYILVAFVIVLFIELFYSSKMLRIQKNDYFSSPHGEIAFLKENVHNYRTLNFGQTGLRPELGSAFQIQEVTSMNQGVLPSFLSYYYSTIELEIPQRFGYHASMMPNGAFPTTLLIKDSPESNKLDLARISLLGVKYIVIPAHYKNYAEYFIKSDFEKVFDSPTSYIFENKNVVPRAFTVDSSYVDSRLYLADDFNEHVKSADIFLYETGSIIIRGYSERESMLVLTDNYHTNWSASLNGKISKIHKINNLFRGVKVPKGEFEVVMSYQPKTLSIAKFCSYMMLVLLILLILFRRPVDSFLHANGGRNER
ncbi:YfhO family protein [Vibrio sinaloensis]|uniref:YfhO family protein n=1 Tax=Photobacterium sp. (strain ATCC 43367) TaxID=379097 RepID=UPI0022AF37FB|nr:YfhO family protein [Vibrio sinaloensis]MCZ4294812.1 YfhO family protein [Vibrio sinaloensis]